MPSKPHDPSKPSVYADTHTICDAHLAANGKAGASPEYAPLGPWIERVAKDANLCLSVVHMGELSKWMRTTEADHIAQWLDALPIVWVKGIERTQDDEAEYWVRVALGATSSEPVRPCAPSFGSALAEMNLETTADLLRDPTIPRLLRDSRKMNWDAAKQAGFDVARMFREDRAAMRSEGGTEADLAKRIEAKREAHLRGIAAGAHQRLRGKEGYSTRLSVPEIQDRFIDLYRKERRAMPSLRIGFTYDLEFSKAVDRRTPGSKKDEDQLPGTFGDRIHACVGAAYCDVFTCDRATLDAVVAERRELGFAHTFAPRGYLGGLTQYVKDLTALP